MTLPKRIVAQREGNGKLSNACTLVHGVDIVNLDGDQHACGPLPERFRDAGMISLDDADLKLRIVGR